MEKAEISIIILAKNESRNIRACLEGVFRQKINCLYEVILIDSGSRDDTLAITRQYPIKIHQIRPEEFGHGRTRNLGATLAQGRFLVFLTADAIPANEQWLSKLVEGIKDREDLAASFSRQLPKPEASPMERWDILKVNPQKREIKRFVGPCSKQKMRVLISFQDVSSCLKREAWGKRKFNEELIMAEDQDWAKRALQAGFGILYEPDSIVFHSHSYNLKDIFQRSFDEARSLSEILVWPIFPNPFKEIFTFLYQVGHDLYSILKIKEDRKGKWFIEVPVYRFMRRAGLFLGSYHRYIPWRWHQKFSYYAARRRE